MSIKDKLFSHSVLYAIGTVASKATGFLLLPLYTSYLSQAEYGLMESLDILVMVIVLTFGLEAITRAMMRVYQEQECPEHQRRVISSSLLLAFGISVFIALSGVLLAKFISNAYINVEDIKKLNLTMEHVAFLFQISFLAVIPTTLIEILMYNIQLKNKPLFVVCFDMVRLLISVSLNIYFIGVLQIGISGFVYSVIISGSLCALFLLIHYFYNEKFSISKESIYKVIHYGYPFILSSLAFFVIHFFDRYVLKDVSGIDVMGVYALAYKFAFLVTFIVGVPFKDTWKVNVFRIANEAGWEDFFSQVFSKLSLALAFVGLLIILFFDNLMGWIIHHKFYDAVFVIPFIIIGYVIREQGDFFSEIICIKKDSKFVGKATLVVALINIALSLALIPFLGMIGAGLATLLTWAVYTWLFFIKQNNIYHISFKIKEWGIPMLALCVLPCIEYFIIHLPFIINILIDIVMMLIFCFVVIQFKLIDPKQLMQSILSLVKKNNETT